MITFFIDMDGVLADFVESAVELVSGLHRDIIMRGWPKGVRDIHTVLKVDKERFWRMVSDGGKDFWHSLRHYSWSMPLYNRLGSIGSRIILSSPTRDPKCVAGKLGWLQAHFHGGSVFRDYLFAPSHQKQLLAGKNRILIDDSQRNVEQWKQAGGRAVLVPQPWNWADPVPQDAMADYLMGLVQEEVQREWE